VATCPSGHASASDDFCDVCGVLIGAAPSLAPGGRGTAAPAGAPGGDPASGTGAAGETSARVPVPDEACPRCGVTRAGQFCESCGYDFTTVSRDTLDPAVYRSSPPASPAAARPAQPPAAPVRAAAPGGAEWTAVVSADRAYYDAVQAAGGQDAAGIAFPAYVPHRRFPLAGTEIRIGRHSASSGIDPEIDLSLPPADPGVSRLHAVLLRAPDGTWSVVDPGSANGTAVNGSEIPQGQLVPLHDGDRIHLGAWTAIRLVCGG
jgi:FHA domain